MAHQPEARFVQEAEADLEAGWRDLYSVAIWIGVGGK